MKPFLIIFYCKYNHWLRLVAITLQSCDIKIFTDKVLKHQWSTAWLSCILVMQTLVIQSRTSVEQYGGPWDFDILLLSDFVEKILCSYSNFLNLLHSSPRLINDYVWDQTLSKVSNYFHHKFSNATHNHGDGQKFLGQSDWWAGKLYFVILKQL